jgi:hypothetical protein
MDALLVGREKWTARWKRALLLAKSERRWAMDALLGGREKWTGRWKRALLLAG